MCSKKTKFEKIVEKLHGASKQKKVQDYSLEQFSYAAYIKAWQLIREKRTMLLAHLQKEEDFSCDEIWYDVPYYLECICEKVQKLIGGIAKIDYRNISVTVLYQIPSSAENEWKSVQGGEQPCKINTEEFMENQDILFSKLVNKDILNFYQDNNISGQNKEEFKENNGMKLNDRVTFGIRTDFEDERESYV
ncbi:MAG: hypothetical protein Q4D16_24210, partial [Eubacteriales bacterium]|nr:hypothetical protein [Eubacteriales bacterium]